MILFFQLFPHYFKMLVLPVQELFRLLFRTCEIRKCHNIAAGSMDINKLWRKAHKRFLIEHYILPVLCVFRLIKNRPDSVIHQK